MNFFSKKVSTEQEFLLHEGVHTIDLNGYSGSINWVAAEGELSRIVAEKQVTGLQLSVIREFLGSIQVQESGSESEIVLQAVKPNHPFGVFYSQVRFTVFASPQQIKKFRSKTSNGSISVDVPFSGDLRLKTSNGRIELHSGVGKVDLRTSNGRIEFGKLQLTESSFMRTSNGRIQGQVELPAEGSYNFDTSNGRIELQLPNDTPGNFYARTSNGGVEICLGTDRVSDRNEVKLQREEGPALRATTSNGKISILGY